MTVAAAHPTHEALTQRELGLDDLRELMRHVTDTTLSLQQTHDALQSQVKRLKDELAEANRQLTRTRQLAALGEMAAGIAHEIRNPLASIQLYVHAMCEDLADRPDQQAICRKVAAAVTGVEAIIRDVLAFSRETRIAPQSVASEQIVQRTLEACEGLLQRSGIQVEVKIEPGSTAFADPLLMVQALGNVVGNAVEAMSEQPSESAALSVCASVRGVRYADGRRRRCVVFAVRDTGPGISPEVIDRMFNPFFTTRAAGTGLGLAIVHRIVDAHGGHINVQNVHDMEGGGGAIVELCIPCSASDAPQSSQPISHVELASTLTSSDDAGTLLPQDAA